MSLEVPPPATFPRKTPLREPMVVVMTTRPAKTKTILDVDIPRPRDYQVLSSNQFRVLMEDAKDAVHEEAVKAFEAGERELA